MPRAKIKNPTSGSQRRVEPGTCCKVPDLLYCYDTEACDAGDLIAGDSIAENYILGNNFSFQIK